MEIIKSKGIDNDFLLFAIIILASFTANMLISRGCDLSFMTLDYNAFTYSGELFSNFAYIFLKRIKQLLIIGLLLRCLNPKIVVRLLWTISGIFFGFLITVQIFYYGYQGIFYIMLCLLPHYPVYIFLIKKLYDFNIYYKNERVFVRYFAFVLLLLAIGLVLEGFFSRFFLVKYYQYID